jgi:VCBS repeat protein/FG-GAP repeat protein
VSRMFYYVPVCLLLTSSCLAEHAPHDQRLSVGDGPGIVEVFDANGDGAMDLVVANERSGNASVLLGNGKGGFSPAPGTPFSAGHSPNDIAIADFNRDGHPDLAFANHETQSLTVLLGDGRGGFVPSPGSPVRVTVRPHPHGIAAADFNGDGYPDLVTDSWGENRLEILLGDGKGGFQTPGTYVQVGKHPYQRIRAADVNRDGKADIVSPNLDGNDVTILLGNGRGSFEQPAGSPFACGDSPFNIAVGDVNNDGFADLAIVNSPSSTAERSGRDGLTILLGHGDGRFLPAPGSPLAMGSFPNLVAIGDINGDAIADIVVSRPDAGQLTVFTMTRSGAVASRRVLQVPGHPKGLAIYDFNGDGKGDIAVTNNSQNTVTIIFSK